MGRQFVLWGASMFLWTALLPGAARAADSNASIRIATGVEYTSGDYDGSVDIDETYIPVSLSVTGRRIGVRLTVPYLTVSGPESVLYGDFAGEIDAGDGPDTRESGLGDIVGAVTFFDLVSSSRHGLAVDLTAKFKLGTADASKGLGTGENDYSALLDIYKFLDRTTLVATVGYKFRGEPAGVSLDNVFLGSAGILFDVGNRSGFGIFYDFREASLAGMDPLRELSLFGSHDLSNAWKMQYYVFSGFTDSGPDWGAGLRFGFNLARPVSRHLD